ncbi:MAG: hypothetical protein ACOC1P_05880, partial [Minisyncoccales bacterium]
RKVIEILRKLIQILSDTNNKGIFNEMKSLELVKNKLQLINDKVLKKIKKHEKEMYKNHDDWKDALNHEIKRLNGSHIINEEEMPHIKQKFLIIESIYNKLKNSLNITVAKVNETIKIIERESKKNDKNESELQKINEEVNANLKLILEKYQLCIEFLHKFKEIEMNILDEFLSRMTVQNQSELRQIEKNKASRRRKISMQPKIRGKNTHDAVHKWKFQAGTNQRKQNRLNQEINQGYDDYKNPENTTDIYQKQGEDLDNFRMNHYDKIQSRRDDLEKRKNMKFNPIKGLDKIKLEDETEEDNKKIS